MIFSRKRFFTTLAIAVIVAFSVAPVIARSGMTRGCSMGAMGPGGNTEYLVAHLTEALSLTDEQRDAIHEKFDQSRIQTRPFIEAMVKNAKQAHALIDVDAFDEAALREMFREKADAMTEMMLVRARTRHEIRALLTEEQREKMRGMHNSQARGFFTHP